MGWGGVRRRMGMLAAALLLVGASGDSAARGAHLEGDAGASAQRKDAGAQQPDADASNTQVEDASPSGSDTCPLSKPRQSRDPSGFSPVPQVTGTMLNLLLAMLGGPGRACAHVASSHWRTSLSDSSSPSWDAR